MIEDNTNVIEGLSPLVPILNGSVGKLIYDKLLENCTDNEAMIDALTGESLSYKELLGKTCTLAESLARSGYNETTMVSICSENCLEFFVPILASLYIGAPIAPINYTYTQQETCHALRIAKPRIIFCSKLLLPTIKRLQKQESYVKQILVINDPNCPESIENFNWKNLGTKEILYRFKIADVDVNENVAFILYSSGTTGLPKGVMITQKNVLTRFSQAEDPRFFLPEENRCTLAYLPFFHAYGLFVGLNSIHKLIKIVIIKKFDEKLFLSCIEKYRITGLPLVPPVAVFLAKSPLVNNYDLSSVKDVGCGAAPLSKETEELLKKRLKVNSLKQAYGLTECTLAVTQFPLNLEKSGSSGQILPYTLCKIRDPETGKSLGPNQVGEICVKGPMVMKGYYGNLEATRNTFTQDGWLLTGDLGYYDEDKFFFIVGRLKELIKYKGFQVAPAELEAILLTNPKIKDCGVIGIPDEDAGELPLAFIVENPNFKITEDEIHQFLEDKVSSHKKLRGGILFIPEIPKNASGKILRKKLHELYNKYYRSKL